jgi:hypothetical protein
MDLSRACARLARAFRPSRYVLTPFPGRFSTVAPNPPVLLDLRLGLPRPSGKFRNPAESAAAASQDTSCGHHLPRQALGLSLPYVPSHRTTARKRPPRHRAADRAVLDSLVADDREPRMSENTDWTLIVRASQQAKVAAEAAVASAKLLESEAGHRLSAMEARLGAIEGRIANLAAGQNSHELAIMRIADTQADHTARLSRIETLLTDIARKLGA